MREHIKIQRSTVALPGRAHPQIAARDGEAWISWAAPPRESNTIRLEPVTGSRPNDTEIVLSKLKDGKIEEACRFPVREEVIKPRCLAVSEGGPVVLWTVGNATASGLMAGNGAGDSTSLFGHTRIWDAGIVTLGEGTIFLGVIELDGKHPLLQFYRFFPHDNFRVEKAEGLDIDGAWSLSMAPLGNERFWVACDRYVSDRFEVAAGVGEPEAGELELRPLPGTGFATDPHIISMSGDRSCIVWSEDKAWGSHEYDFKRKSRIKLAEITPDEVVFCEDLPMTTAPWDDDEQQMPCSPTAVALEDGLHVFFRRPRAEIKGGSRVNDWGWQLWESLRSPDGTWQQPRIFSRENLFSALQNRRCFSSNGPRLATCLRVNGTFMGGVACDRSENTIDVEVVPTTRLSEVRLIRDGEIIAKSQLSTSDPVSVEFSDAPDHPSPHFYYAEIRQAPEPGLAYPGIAWTRVAVGSSSVVWASHLWAVLPLRRRRRGPAVACAA